MQIENEVRKM